MSVNVEGVSSSPAIASFIQKFYELSDTEQAHEEYADSCDYDAPLFFQIGPMEPVSTRDGVLSWRHKAWEPVASRKHTINDVFTHPNKKNEVMLYGRVDYKKKDGTQAGATWGGRMVFDSKSIDAGKPKMTFYRVWLVSPPTEKLRAPSSF